MTTSTGYGRQTGERMRQIRKDRGLTLKGLEIASRRRFNGMTVGCYERGDRAIRVEWLAGYAQWLGVDIMLLLPPEPEKEAWMAGLTAKVAGKAVSDVTDLFSSVGPDEARKLLAEALDDLGGAA